MRTKRQGNANSTRIPSVHFCCLLARPFSTDYLRLAIWVEYRPPTGIRARLSCEEIIPNLMGGHGHAGNSSLSMWTETMRLRFWIRLFDRILVELRRKSSILNLYKFHLIIKLLLLLLQDKLLNYSNIL